jgi:hypothetical protein
MKEWISASWDYILAAIGAALFIVLEYISTRRDQRQRSSREQLREGRDGVRRRRDRL